MDLKPSDLFEVSVLDIHSAAILIMSTFRSTSKLVLATLVLLSKKGNSFMPPNKDQKLALETTRQAWIDSYSSDDVPPLLAGIYFWNREVAEGEKSAKPEALGTVLLDEIEKAGRDVIHGLYLVIDKAEWTNIRLFLGRESQTETVPCHNLVFIMTTNSCDHVIETFAEEHKKLYGGVGEDFQEIGEELEGRLRSTLQFTSPFTEAFIGRIGRIVPCLPMSNGDPDTQHPLLGEMMAVAKLPIERQQEKYESMDTTEVQQSISAKTKHRMAKIVVKDSIRKVVSGRSRSQSRPR